ncbi:hypothetical protein K678_07582 [Magnetospirillum fulvum MGU-K5]|uniref:Uncharacterized protein n=1 Tax=Magnetospirillum fulvum MGU-K5 TaxID=1316936 RepID=S9S8C9_MAGFU|nr:hypothetical protein K678_07582 [Magnetospirillum fulvum MGU-K5]
MSAFLALVPFLRLDRQRRDRTGFQAADADRLAGILAIAVGPILDPLQRGVDFGDQLTLAVTRAQFQGAVGFGGGTIGDIRLLQAPFLEVLQGFVRFAQQLGAPPQKFQAEVLLHDIAHEEFILGRMIIRRQRDGHSNPRSRGRSQIDAQYMVRSPPPQAPSFIQEV